jgi:hypothetical protein
MDWRKMDETVGGHPASYPMGNESSFPGGKAAGALSWPLISISA